MIVAKNKLGVAFGFLEGTSKIRPISVLMLRPARRHPVYSEDESLAIGRWRIIDHDEQAMPLFPAEPEIFHRKKLVQGGPEIGPYGSGEAPSGRMRRLTNEEAEELGLLSGEYRQGYTPQYLELCLNGM